MCYIYRSSQQGYCVVMVIGKITEKALQKFISTVIHRIQSVTSLNSFLHQDSGRLLNYMTVNSCNIYIYTVYTIMYNIHMYCSLYKSVASKITLPIVKEINLLLLH